MSTTERIEEQNFQVVKNHELPAGESEAWIAAIQRTQAVIEFSPDGTILDANENFLMATGYDIDEIKGKHHRMFCDPEYVKGPEYKDFWKKLNAGTSETGEFKRLGKNGREVWIVASYSPILGSDGKVQKVVKFATDVTDSKVELQVRTDIMNMTSIVSEADLKGDILTINEKYMEVSKFKRDELIGQGHNITRHPEADLRS